VGPRDSGLFDTVGATLVASRNLGTNTQDAERTGERREDFQFKNDRLRFGPRAAGNISLPSNCARHSPEHNN